MNRLSCKGISKSYGGVNALADLSIEFPLAGIVAVIGPNGAGKTTLLNVLTGFSRPDSGDVFLGSNRLTRLPPERIATLGITRTFQETRLIRAISVLENVLLARQHRSGERLWRSIVQRRSDPFARHLVQEAEELLALVGLSEKATADATNLSYGQQKLLTLACVMAMQSKVVLLDEPVSGLSPQMISETLGLLDGLRRQGRLVIFVEHDMEAVARIAEDVIVMDAGAVIARGPPDKALNLPNVLEAYID